jgi:hypothetical protein
MPNDSLFVKRPPIKKAGPTQPSIFDRFAKELAGDFGELKRQTGAAVENVKSSYRKIREAIKP